MAWLREVAEKRRQHASDCFLRFDDEAGDSAVAAAEAHDFAADFIERGDHLTARANYAK